MVTDTSTPAKPNLIQRIRDFLDSLGELDAAPDAPDDVQGTPTEEVTASEIDAAEAETEAQVEGEPATEPGDGEPAETTPAAEPPESEPAETTPGTSDTGDAELDDLRSQLTEQAATIETLRNTVAELGGVDPTEAADIEEITADEGELSEDEVVSDFDADYDERAAILANLSKES